MSKIEECLEKVEEQCVPYAYAHPRLFNKASRALGSTKDLAQTECNPTLILLSQILLLAKRVEELEQKADK